jgi:hypothetical protein
MKRPWLSTPFAIGLIGIGRAAEMLERQLLQPVEMQCRADLVIGEPQIVRLHRHCVFEAGENEYPLGTALADKSPGMLQLFEIVRGGRQDVAAGVGQVRREPIAKTMDIHPNLPVKLPSGYRHEAAPFRQTQRRAPRRDRAAPLCIRHDRRASDRVGSGTSIAMAVCRLGGGRV